MDSETEALRRCARLLALIEEAMRMEHAHSARLAGSDTSTTGLVRPILEQALVRLEPMLAGLAVDGLQPWLGELVDLEMALDTAIARRGWRALELAPMPGDTD